MEGQTRPTCWIIAGPNGAGKTTFALKYLPEMGCQSFVNADLIAARMSPLAPERERLAASRIFLGEIERHIQARHHFGFETTLAGCGYLRLIERLKGDGWRVELHFLALGDPGMAKQRVAERVRHGGHDIPAPEIERRFLRSLNNLFDAYAHLVDSNHLRPEQRRVPGPRVHAVRRAPRSARTCGDENVAEVEAIMTEEEDYETKALRILTEAVAEALERKRLLGQYAVFWRDGKVVCVGPDAPTFEYLNAVASPRVAHAVAEPDGG